MIAILGTTTTGKTDLAYALSRLIPSEIISYDSRHVYKGMTVGTGKDLPVNADFSPTPLPHFRLPDLDTSIWLMDTVSPDEDWSVAQFVREANQVVERLAEEKKTPILVGGTMFYLQQFLNPAVSLGVLPDSELRSSLAEKSTKELQEILKNKDADRLDRMNNSDRNNPARLVRAIEIVASDQLEKLEKTQEKNSPPAQNAALVCIDLPFSIIQERIQTRVERRFSDGMIEEVEQLIATYPDWNASAFSALGYKEVRAFLEKKITKTEAIENWVLAEMQYAKRQLVWIKKLESIYNILRITPTQAELQEYDQYAVSENLAKRVMNWYDSTHDKDRD